MKELLNKEIEMEDGNRYLVVDVISIDKKNYALISNVSDMLSSFFVEVKINNDKISFKEVANIKTRFEIARAMQG